MTKIAVYFLSLFTNQGTLGCVRQLAQTGRETRRNSAIAKAKSSDTFFSYGWEMFNLKKDVYFITLLLIFILYNYIYHKYIKNNKKSLYI